MNWLKVGGIIVLIAILIFGGFIVYKNATDPNTVQRAKEMTNITYHYDYHPIGFGGCARFPTNPADKESKPIK